MPLASCAKPLKIPPCSKAVRRMGWVRVSTSTGSTPARIWRDFMRGALKLEAAPKPKTQASPDPEGPVQQLDIEGGEIPLGQDGATLSIDGNGVTIKQEGVPVEVRVDQGGVAVQPAPSPSAQPPP